MSPSEVVVGVDGSPGSIAALKWATAEAARRDSELVVVHAYDWRIVGARVQIGGASADDARARAREISEAALAEARSLAPAVKVRGEIVQGAPGPVLVEASGDGRLVVLGSRGRGGFASLLLGSVSQQVATHAAGSVAVVRGRSQVTTGPVIVGVDGSSSADHAFAIAISEAVMRGSDVVAIRAYAPTIPRWDSPVPPHIEDWEERRTTELKLLLDDVAPWAGKYPDVPIECLAIAGNVAEALVRHSANAQLVVVGTRGHGGFAGLLLGSVGLQLLHHAECPVLIARPTEAPT
jgi:nucleotide-binding universal stress UspA family protein